MNPRCKRRQLDSWSQCPSRKSDPERSVHDETNPSALLQKNVLNRQSWGSREELRIAIVTWIERTYHRRRRQDGLGRLTPVEFEMIMAPVVELAA
jgi:transposase InsO family protein